MIPGLTTKLSEETLASAATIFPKADLVILTGTTSLENIRQTFGGGFSGFVAIVPKDGVVATVATGNIAIAVSMPQNRVTVLVYSRSQDKWYPGAIS